MTCKQTARIPDAINFLILCGRLSVDGVMFVRTLNEADGVRHRLGSGRSSTFQLSMAKLA